MNAEKRFFFQLICLFRTISLLLIMIDLNFSKNMDLPKSSFDIRQRDFHLVQGVIFINVGTNSPDKSCSHPLLSETVISVMMEISELI